PGSIVNSTLDVVRRNRHQFQVYALGAGGNVEALTAQILEFRPRVAVVATSSGLSRLTQALTDSGLSRADWPELASGERALVEIATASEVDTVLSAIVGVAGLEATFEAVCRGKRIGLANKEVLVSAGRLDRKS